MFLGVDVWMDEQADGPQKVLVRTVFDNLSDGGLFVTRRHNRCIYVFHS